MILDTFEDFSYETEKIANKGFKVLDQYIYFFLIISFKHLLFKKKYLNRLAQKISVVKKGSYKINN